MTPSELSATLHGIGWSQSELARKVGVRPATVTAWMHGHSRIPPWLDAHLGLVVEIAALHETYVARIGPHPVAELAADSDSDADA